MNARENNKVGKTLEQKLKQESEQKLEKSCAEIIYIQKLPITWSNKDQRCQITPNRD